ncbi:hypothetical protein Tco_1546405 [Tanacetum coccineum]
MNLELHKSTTCNSKDKGKAIMIEPEVPLKIKIQVALGKRFGKKYSSSDFEDKLIEEKKVVKSKKGTEESSKGTEDELESDKSKKAECSEEKAKGSKKKMLGRKRAGKEQQQESSKKQRMEDDKETDEVEEVEEDDEAELKISILWKIDKYDEIAN